jgi:hypothetical protein
MTKTPQKASRQKKKLEDSHCGLKKPGVLWLHKAREMSRILLHEKPVGASGPSQHLVSTSASSA